MRPSHRPARRLALAVVALATVASAACLRRAAAPPELYRLRAIPRTEASAGGIAGADRTDGAGAVAASAPLLTVEPYATPGVYGEPQIVYREGDTRYGTYPNREWALPLGTMLAALTSERLRLEPALAVRVQDGARAAAGGGLLWRGVVREFEEVDRGGRVFAVVRLDATLVRAADDSVLWSGSARAEGGVGQTTDMTVVVDSLSSLATRVVATLARDAGPVLRAAGALTPAREAPRGRPR